uniref:Endo-1,4-D-glucanase n=1 Tax=mine drainage metagenome TaxID=410659 RepID=E6QIZ0_9ZZZZ
MVGALAARSSLGQGVEEPARLWQAYTAQFLSSDGRIVDPQGGDRTTSEGQSYALFFSLVNNDKARFEAVLEWTEKNLAEGDLGAHLPAWEWGKKKDGTWGALDPNSAADSDLWIAYDLIEAGRLWHDSRYVALGKRMLPLIARRETAVLPAFGPVLLPAANGFHLKNSWILNPCYTPVFLLERLAKVDPAGPWIGIAIKTPELIARSSPGGFAMDWVSYTPGTGFQPSLSNAVKEQGALGSYDAIRVYLWTGMLSDELPAKRRMMHALNGMSQYLTEHGAPPEKVNSQGAPFATDGPVGFSAAVLPFLESIPDPAEVARQAVRMKSQLDEKTGLYGKVPTYYDQNLILFGGGWLARQYHFASNGELIVSWTHG